MKIIAIEGLDKAGKASQSKMLKDYLESLGYKVIASEFHRYDQPTGDLIAKWLRNEWDVDQETIQLIMTADKQSQQKWFAELEEQDIDFLILDRYTGSQEVYARANGISPIWTAVLLKNIRQPDLEVFIDIPPEDSMSRKGKHNNGENDRYESDYDLLTRVRALYLERKNIKIDGLQLPNDVHTSIVNSIQPFIIK